MPGISEIPSVDLLSRADEAYDALKRLILANELVPGQWLRKRDIAARLGMSPTPVVEALRRLEHEGLVTIVPQYGARVRAWTVDEIAEGIELRAALEGLIAGRCAVVAEDWQIAQLRALAEKVDRDDARLCDPQQPQTIQLGMANVDDLRFHQTLARISGFRLVARQIQRLHLLQITGRLFVFPADPSDITHTHIVEAIAARDQVRADSLMRRQCQHTRTVLPHLRARFGDGAVVFESTSSSEPDPTLPDRRH